MIEINTRIDVEKDNFLWVEGEVKEDGEIIASFKYLQSPEAMSYLRQTIEQLTS